MVIVVVGASGGLGEYVAGELAREYMVIGTYHTTSVEIPGIEIVGLDIRSYTAISSFVDKVRSCDGDVVLINMASLSCASLAHTLLLADWFNVIDVNMHGAYYLCRAFLKLMRDRGWGRIINISSVVPHLGVPGTSAYSASKLGVEGLTKVLARENATRGITVNALALGYFDRGMIESVPDKMMDSILSTIPMRHLGHPKNIVAAIRFLIDSDYTTGTTIHIDGGLT